MRSIFLTIALLFVGVSAEAAPSRICLFDNECWVALTEEENPTVVRAVNTIVSESPRWVRDEEADGFTWFRVYKRVPRQNGNRSGYIRNLRVERVSEEDLRTLLSRGMDLFRNTPYSVEMNRFEPGYSDFYTSILDFLRSSHSYNTRTEAREKLNFTMQRQRYDREGNGHDVRMYQNELRTISNFIKDSAFSRRQDNYDKLTIYEFNEGNHNENYEYLPYLFITEEYAITALHRWQL